MKKNRFTYLLFLCFLFSQNLIKSQERTAYLIDSIVFLKQDLKFAFEIDSEKINKYKLETNKNVIRSLAINNIDSLFIITTKAFLNRPNHLKQIPSTRQMKNTNTVWYYKNKPYTGKYIDYYLSGEKESEGNMVNGKIENNQTSFFIDGSVREKLNFKKSLLNGTQYFYYRNGNIKSKLNYLNGQKNGLYQTFFANGNIQISCNYKNGSVNSEVSEYYSKGGLKIKYKSQFPRVNGFRNPTISKFYSLIHREGVFVKENLDILSKNNYSKSFTKQLKRLLKDYNKQIKKNNTLDILYKNRGVINFFLGNYNNCYLDFERAINLEPYNKEFLYLMAYSIYKKHLDTPIPEIPKNELELLCQGISKFDKVRFLIEKESSLMKQKVSSYCEK